MISSLFQILDAQADIRFLGGFPPGTPVSTLDDFFKLFKRKKFKRNFQKDKIQIQFFHFQTCVIILYWCSMDLRVVGYLCLSYNWTVLMEVLSYLNC